MWADDVVYELDLLGTILGKESCVGFERGEVVFSGAALVGAEYYASLIKLG
jgi:hypothetical protein